LTAHTAWAQKKVRDEFVRTPLEQKAQIKIDFFDI